MNCFRIETDKTCLRAAGAIGRGRSANGLTEYRAGAGGDEAGGEFRGYAVGVGELGRDVRIGWNDLSLANCAGTGVGSEGETNFVDPCSVV